MESQAAIGVINSMRRVWGSPKGNLHSINLQKLRGGEAKKKATQPTWKEKGLEEGERGRGSTISSRPCQNGEGVRGTKTQFDDLWGGLKIGGGGGTKRGYRRKPPLSETLPNRNLSGKGVKKEQGN